MKPMQVTSKNAFQVLHNLYGTFSACQKGKLKIIFKKGDLIRISILRGVFDKKYEDF